jgi:hypothetical protein
MVFAGASEGGGLEITECKEITDLETEQRS